LREPVQRLSPIEQTACSIANGTRSKTGWAGSGTGGARKALLMHHSVEDLELSKGQMHGEYIRDSNASDQK
jgi:hypothetical protein